MIRTWTVVCEQVDEADGLLNLTHAGAMELTMPDDRRALRLGVVVFTDFDVEDLDTTPLVGVEFGRLHSEGTAIEPLEVLLEEAEGNGPSRSNGVIVSLTLSDAYRSIAPKLGGRVSTPFHFRTEELSPGIYGILTSVNGKASSQAMVHLVKE